MTNGNNFRVMTPQINPPRVENMHCFNKFDEKDLLLSKAPVIKES